MAVIGRTRGVAVTRHESIDNVRVLRRVISFNEFAPPAEDVPVLAPLRVPGQKFDPIRLGTPQGVTDAGTGGSYPKAVPMAVVPKVDINGVRLPEEKNVIQPDKPKPPDGGGEVDEPVTVGVFAAGTLPAGSILLRTVIENVTKFEGDTADISIGTKEEPGQFGTIGGEEALPGGKDIGVPETDFLVDDVNVVVTVTVGEDIKKLTAGSVAFAVFYLASNAKGKAAEPAVIESLNPDEVAIGEPSFTLSVKGTNFKDGDVIVFNGNDEPTTKVSAEEVTTGVNMDYWHGPSEPLPVYVRSANGQKSNELEFTFLAGAAKEAS